MTELIFDNAIDILNMAAQDGAAGNHRDVNAIAGAIAASVEQNIRDLDLVSLRDGTPLIKTPVFDAEGNPVPFDQRIVHMFHTLGAVAILTNPELRACVTMFWYGAELNKGDVERGNWIGRQPDQSVGPVTNQSDVYGCIELCSIFMDQMHKRVLAQIQADYNRSVKLAKELLALNEQKEQLHAGKTQPPSA